jgi:hypothetical protein
MHVEFWWGNLTRRDHLKDLDINGRITSKWILKKQDAMMWIGFILLRIGTCGGIL